MARFVLGVAAIAVCFVLFRGVLTRSDGTALPSAQVDTTGVPQEFRSLLAYHPDPGAILSSRGALPGLGVIRELVGHHDGGDDAPPAPAPFGDVGTRGQIRQVERHIRRDLDALDALDDGATTAEAEQTLSLVYSAATLKALGPSGVRAFAGRVAGATRASQRIRVLDYDGVFVAGDRALAQVVYRLSVRAPSGRFIAHTPSTWTVTLAKEDGRWRFVHGIES
jgi:hypothetical protein